MPDPALIVDHSVDPAAVARWRKVPMREWPTAAFERLGLRSPYAPGNLTLRREALEATRALDGCVVECGTYQGQGLASLAWLMREAGDARAWFSCDSFQGFPPAGPEDRLDGVLPEACRSDYFAGTNEAAVRRWLEGLGLAEAITLVPGFFHETLRLAPFARISVLILDCDLYDSYRICLQALYPKVQRGGWIVFDEYFSPKYPGARIAVDEFFRDKPEKPMIAKHLLAQHPYERWYVVKS